MKLAPDIDIRHLSGPEWCHLLTSFNPPPRPGFPREESDFILRVLCEEKVVKLWHNQRGRLDPEKSWATQTSKELSQHFDGARVMSLTTDALTQLTNLWQRQLDPRGDFLDQILGLISLVGQTPGLDIHPPPPWLSVPSFLRSTVLNMLFPKNRCFVFLVTKEGQVWTSLILRHGADGLDLMTGSEAFFDQRPQEVGPSWIHPLCRLVEEHYGPIHGAMAFDWAAYWNFRRQPTREALANLKKQGDIVMPHWPFSWNVLHWSLDRGHKKKLRSMSDEDQKRYSEALSEAQLAKFL